MKRIGIILIFVFSIMVNVYFGFQKAGFHEDEYYTYFSSNRTMGLYQPDRQWQDRQTILDEFVVKPGEGFRFGLVRLVQSWDVHPPFYYYIFHTACSIVPGVFTKWTGIITNLLAFALCFWILYLILERLRVSAGMQAAALLFYGVNPQIISCNMLIRMYAWLSLFVALCAYLHVRMVQEEEKENSERKFFIGHMLPIMIVSYLGFLTQYFYLFFFVAIGVSYSAYVVFWKKNLKRGILYVSSCTVSLLLAVISYPASVRHLFGGYRGSEAAGSIFDLGNTFMRLSFFADLLNDFVFGGFFYLIVILLLVMVIASYISKKVIQKSDGSKQISQKDSFGPEYIILTLGTIGYFLLTAKAALLVGSASNRYEMPAYGLIIIIVFASFNIVFNLKTDTKNIRKIRSYTITIVFAAVVFLLIKGININDRVLFLYREDTEKIEYATQNSEGVAVVMFNPATPHNVWRLTDELLEYRKVFYMDEENLNKLTEPEIVDATRITLYVADDDYQEEAINNLMDSVELTNISQLFSEDMWKTYEIY